ncbi:hypothetical protein NITHO_4240015 [Nitrolancea hollandica Lb]|uniref:Uncharacterized protein n=1 Tax=Nitrolancea hollandica Lb TaxID=1129897 RepID=I4EJV0_9BACT|nr:hypothetical protein NITHO_4240015 [Nitrolancea hollandica Lb]
MLADTVVSGDVPVGKPGPAQVREGNPRRKPAAEPSEARVSGGDPVATAIVACPLFPGRAFLGVPSGRKANANLRMQWENGGGRHGEESLGLAGGGF